REVGEAGLAALVYYNRGGEFSRAGRHPQALRAYFCALSLDPEVPSAVKNAPAGPAKPGGGPGPAGGGGEGPGGRGRGLRRAPADATLRHNVTAVWTSRALAAQRAGRQDEALRLLRRAAEAVPDQADYFRRMRVLVFVVPGERHVAAGRWGRALALAEA